MIVDTFWEKGLSRVLEGLYPHIIRVPYPLGITWHGDGFSFCLHPTIEQLAKPTDTDALGRHSYRGENIRLPYETMILFHNQRERAILLCHRVHKPEEAVYAHTWIEQWATVLIVDDPVFGGLCPFVFRGGLEADQYLSIPQKDWQARYLKESINMMKVIAGPQAALHFRKSLDDTGFGLQQEKDGTASMPFELGLFMFLTLKLLHTKNIVTTVIHPPAKVQAKRRKHHKLPLFSWHELSMESKAVTKNLISQSTGQLLPVHWVKGHFKEYTPEKPLFGHLTGRYWWQPHLAGRDLDRFVEKTYVVPSQKKKSSA